MSILRRSSAAAPLPVASPSSPIPNSSPPSHSLSLSTPSSRPISIPAILILLLFSFVFVLTGVSIFKSNQNHAAMANSISHKDLIDILKQTEEVGTGTFGKNSGALGSLRGQNEIMSEGGDGVKVHGAKQIAGSDNIISSNIPKDHALSSIESTVATNVISPTKAPIELLSTNCPASSDVRGNLGPASVITNENVKDWLSDRWQAAKDMSGTPILGEHWLEVDLLRACHVHRALIDWEAAYSDAWTLRGFVPIDEKNSELIASSSSSSSSSLLPAIHEHRKQKGHWHILAHSANMTKSPSSSHQHVIHMVDVSKSIADTAAVRFVRLDIHRPSTRWGSSVWRLQLYGRPRDSTEKGCIA